MEQQKLLYWTLIEHNEWRLYVGATTTGICYIGSNDASFDELMKWGERYFKGARWIENPSVFETNKLIDYLDGRRINMELPIDLRGTDFQQQVWKLVMDVPYGETASYKTIAERLGRPSAVRAVAGAIGANPVLFIVPCHRIIGSNGKLTGFRGGLPMKESLLRLEKECKQHK